MTETTPIILSHASALTYWKEHGADSHIRFCSNQETVDALKKARGSVHAKKLSELFAKDAIPLRAPLDLLTDSRNDRRTTRLAHFHCMQGVYPPDALAMVNTPALSSLGIVLYVSSPEFTFLQMTQKLDIWELIELGFELCGRYVSDSTSIRGYTERKPVCTPGRLVDFANQAEGMTGAKQARIAARHIVPDSRSPEETHSCMLACLPRSLGGMGAKPALLNQNIEMPDAAARILGTRTCTPDLFWPDAHIVVEYDSRDFENEDIRAEYERRKSNAYHMLGIDVVSIAHNDLADAKLIRTYFSHINKRCGRRLKEPNQKQRENQEALLAWLRNR